MKRDDSTPSNRTVPQGRSFSTASAQVSPGSDSIRPPPSSQSVTSLPANGAQNVKSLGSTTMGEIILYIVATDKGYSCKESRCTLQTKNWRCAKRHAIYHLSPKRGDVCQISKFCLARPFLNTRDRVYHEVTHLCEFCNRIFSDPRENAAFRKHYHEVHLDVIRYPCPQCPSSFNTTQAGRRHWESIHPHYPLPPEKNFPELIARVFDRDWRLAAGSKARWRLAASPTPEKTLSSALTLPANNHDRNIRQTTPPSGSNPPLPAMTVPPVPLKILPQHKILPPDPFSSSELNLAQMFRRDMYGQVSSHLIFSTGSEVPRDRFGSAYLGKPDGSSGLSLDSSQHSNK